MRTIVLPNPPKDKNKYHIRCVNLECEAVIEVDRSELVYMFEDKEGDFYKLNCPHCKHDITIAHKHLSKFMVKD